MTENKRYSFNWKSGHPNFWDNHCDLADCYLTCGDVVNILNELNDENEQLKQELIEFKKWKKYVGDVKREDLDKVFKMSVYEIADLVLWQEKVKEVLQKYYNAYTQRAIDGKPVSDVTDAIMKIEDELGLELR